MSNYYIGVDPGIRNVGLAVLGLPGDPITKHARVLNENEAIQAVYDWLKQDVVGQAIVGLEGWGDYGPRRGAFKMLQVIGAVQGMCLAMDMPFHVFMPRDKEKVSSQVARPVGMTDHEFDALCLAKLAQLEGKKAKRRGKRD